MTSHSLKPDNRTLRGFFSAEYEPVLRIEPGDSVQVTTLDAWWACGPYQAGPIESRVKVPQHKDGYGHALIGPIEVQGARPGDVLEIRINSVIPGRWGTTAAPQSNLNARYGIKATDAVHTWELDPVAMIGRNQHGHSVALRPFMGVMGMPPDEPGEHLTFPPRECGGNLDCKELVRGSVLYLPISVPGALFSVGDGHARQGDGEICGTAIECPMELVDLTFDVRTDLEIVGPVAKTPIGWITMGLGDTIDDATYSALDSMFALLGRLHNVSRADAVLLTSVAVDLRLTQIVNGVVGVHAVLPPGAIR